MCYNEFVSMEVLFKVCRTLDCDFGDIVEVVKSPVNCTVSAVK
ncbi:MAG: helix-turn-helix transcriptional regulator [Sedimentibacter sp.]